MSQARVFVPQQRLESWLTNGRAALEGNKLSFEGYEFRLEPALHFLSEVATGDDRHSLLGRVKSLEQLAPLAPEQSPDSVIIGDSGYEVVEGFTLSLESKVAHDPYRKLSKLFAAP
jgi:hypothetical protein